MILTSIINNLSSGNPLMATSNNPTVISGTGLWTPEHSVSNEELVEDGYAVKFNREHASDIEAGDMTAKSLSSTEFIAKASGIKNRYVYAKEGILDIDRMHPFIPTRANDEVSQQWEMGLKAARKALDSTN